MADLRPPASLTGKQRRHLRGLGHAIEPVVQIGHQGLTEAVAKAIAEALGAHELIKVRVGKNAPDPDRPGIAQELSERLGCHVAQTVGRVLLLYREAEKREDRRIKLPKPKKVEVEAEAEAEAPRPEAEARRSEVEAPSAEVESPEP